MAGFRHRRRELPLQVSPIRTLHGSSDIHQGGQSHSRTSQEARRVCLYLPRRLAPDSTISKDPARLGSHGLRPSTAAGLRRQLPEVDASTLPEGTVPRVAPELYKRNGVPHRRTSPECNPLCSSTTLRGDTSSSSLDENAGPHRQPQVYATSEHPTNASHPAARSRQIQKPQRQSLPQDQQDSTSLQRPLMVDSAIQCSPREVICSAATSINPNHGCIQGWMGSTLGRHTGIRHVASFSGKEAHQPSRAMGHPPDPSTPSTSYQGHNGSSEVRHVGGHVHQQKGRSPQQVPVPPDNSPAQVVLAVSDNTPSGAPTGGGKQVGQCTVQESVVNPGQAENPGVVSGVAPESDRVSNAVQPPAKTSHRPICQQSQQATSNLRQLGCRSDGVRSGCNGNQLGHDSGLCLPSDCSHPQSAGEDRQLQVMRHDPDSSKVASAAVVPETHLSPSRRSDGPSDPQGPHPDRRRSPSPSSDSSSAESDCMANFIKSYTEAGLSSEAAAIAGEARRPSTRLTYNSCIRKYFKWCRQAAINPHSASLGQVCDFLTAVFKEEGATAHSVRSCKTAVAAVHHGFGEGNTVSNSPAIQDLIKGMFHQRPPTKSLVPSWDLPTALRFWADPHLSHFIRPT